MMEDWYKLAEKQSKEDKNEAFFKKYFDDEKWIPVESSWLSAIAYHELAHVLEIKLTNGQEYTFMSVPKNVFEGFLAAPSKGVFFNEVVRRNYSSQ